MKTLLNHFVTILIVLSAVSCKSGTTSYEEDWKSMTLDQKLESMRNDVEWIHSLDSMAATGIGPGAKCTDPVKHTFIWHGRHFVYNQDWGGVLELPEGYVPDDDTWQVVVSYHGSSVWSPDTSALINHYEGLQTFPYEEFKEMTLSDYYDDSMFVDVSVTEETMMFNCGTESKMLTIETVNEDDIVGWFRYIYSSPNSVEYSVSVQYPLDDEEKYRCLRTFAERYPFGPMNQDPKPSE